MSCATALRIEGDAGEGSSRICVAARTKPVGTGAAGQLVDDLRNPMQMARVIIVVIV